MHSIKSPPESESDDQSLLAQQVELFIIQRQRKNELLV